MDSPVWLHLCRSKFRTPRSHRLLSQAWYLHASYTSWMAVWTIWSTSCSRDGFWLGSCQQSHSLCTSHTNNIFSIVSHHTTVDTEIKTLQRFWEIEIKMTLFLQRNVLSLNSLNSITLKQMMVISEFLFHESPILMHLLVNLIPKLYGDSSCLRDLFIPRISLLTCLKRSTNTSDKVMLNLSHSWHGKTSRLCFLSSHVCLSIKHPVVLPNYVLWLMPLHPIVNENLSQWHTVGGANSIHSSLVNVLLWFHLHHITLTAIADVSHMYHAILNSDDKDLHLFVWRSLPTEPLQYCFRPFLSHRLKVTSFSQWNIFWSWCKYNLLCT